MGLAACWVGCIVMSEVPWAGLAQLPWLSHSSADSRHLQNTDRPVAILGRLKA